MAATLIWKLVLATTLGAAIFASALIRPPRRAYPRADLRVMVCAALGLYCVGLTASLTHHGPLAAGVYACGIAISALAVWLSRGSDRWEPPRREDSPAAPPPAGPDEPPEVDWEAWERQLGLAGARHQPERQPALTR
jgi:hypothetical protein